MHIHMYICVCIGMYACNDDGIGIVEYAWMAISMYIHSIPTSIRWWVVWSQLPDVLVLHFHLHNYYFDSHDTTYYLRIDGIYSA